MRLKHLPEIDQHIPEFRGIYHGLSMPGIRGDARHAELFSAFEVARRSPWRTEQS